MRARWRRGGEKEEHVTLVEGATLRKELFAESRSLCRPVNGDEGLEFCPPEHAVTYHSVLRCQEASRQEAIGMQ